MRFPTPNTLYLQWWLYAMFKIGWKWNKPTLLIRSKIGPAYMTRVSAEDRLDAERKRFQ